MNHLLHRQLILFSLLPIHYVNISMLIKLCWIRVIPIPIGSILLINFIYKILILYKIKLNSTKIGYISTINRNIEKQANITFINAYPIFFPILLYFRCNLRVTFARRCFRVSKTSSACWRMIVLFSSSES